MATKKLHIESKTDALARMIDLAAEATALATVMARRDEAIAAVNEQFAAEIEGTSKRCIALKTALRDWAKENRDCADKDTKTIRFEGVGEIQVRTGNPEVRLARGVDEETAIKRLFDEGLGAYVRTVQELNREAILAERESVSFEAIAACGIRVQQAENVLFTVEGVGKI